MKDFIDSISQPSWWATVVIAGLLVNLLAAYTKPFIDKRFSYLSTKWHERTEKARLKRESLIIELLANNEKMLSIKLDLIYSALVIGIYLLVTILFSQFILQMPEIPALIRIIINLIVFLFLMVLGLTHLWRAVYIEAILDEIKKKSGDSG